MKVLIVFGTRPEAIKLAPIIHELQRRSHDGIQSVVCVTAQHRHMLDQVLELFGLKPDYDLDLMTDSQTPTSIAAAVLRGLAPILRQEQPDWVLVQGDTTTALAAALAAMYAHVRIGHVEAGLRTFDKGQPFPEENNRCLIDRITDLFFAPTARSAANLRWEHVPAERILLTGNSVVDALNWARNQPPPNLSTAGLGHIEALAGRKRIIVVTTHRRENFGTPLEQICAALAEIAARYADVQIVYPVHLNPLVWEPVHARLSGIANIALVAPLDYRVMVHMLERATLVLTDSGGLQEEAPCLGKPVLVLRAVTERQEGVEHGTVRVVGVERALIVAEIALLLDDQAAYAAMAHASHLYGDGQASQRIVQALLDSTVKVASQPTEGIVV